MKYLMGFFVLYVALAMALPLLGLIVFALLIFKKQKKLNNQKIFFLFSGGIFFLILSMCNFIGNNTFVAP